MRTCSARPHQKRVLRTHTHAHFQSTFCTRVHKNNRTRTCVARAHARTLKVWVNFSSIPCSTSKEESIWKIFFMSLLLLLHPVASSVKWIFFSLLLCASLGCTIFLKYAHLPYFLICSHSIPFYVSEKMSGKCTIYIQIRSRHASPAETSAKNE